MTAVRHAQEAVAEVVTWRAEALTEGRSVTTTRVPGRNGSSVMETDDERCGSSSGHQSNSRSRSGSKVRTRPSLGSPVTKSRIHSSPSSWITEPSPIHCSTPSGEVRDSHTVSGAASNDVSVTA